MASNRNAFDRDFAYLMPFLDKVESSAADLADSSAREELLSLMAEERQRWNRVRALLAGAAGAAPSSGPRPGAERVVTEVVPQQLTVGSLKAR